MKKLFNYLLVISIIVFSLLQIVLLFSFNTNYYHKENEKLRLYEKVEMKEEDVNTVFDEMFDYLKDEQQDLNEHTYKIADTDQYFFNEREVLHMKDVKNLFAIVLNVRNIAAIFALASIFLYKFFDFKLMNKAFKEVLFLILCFVFAVGIYAMVDFSSFWVSFHECLFTNDLWLLDYRTCLLIRIMPEVLFNDLVMPLVITLFVYFSALGAILYFLKGRINND